VVDHIPRRVVNDDGKGVEEVVVRLLESAQELVLETTMSTSVKFGRTSGFVERCQTWPDPPLT
jgi:hypothetical protein